MWKSFKPNWALIFNQTNIRIWAVLSVVLAMAGPFGTIQADSFVYRLLYWSVIVLLSGVIGQWSCQVVGKTFPRENRWLKDAVRVGCATIILTPIIWGLTVKIFKFQVTPTPGFFTIATYVAVISAALRVFWRSVLGLDERGYFRNVEALKRSVPPRLARRLPDSFDGAIVRLTGRDHFVDVVSDQGLFSIRMRFGDAIEEMDTVPGYCTHRSHWVTKDAIESVQRANGRIHLILKNGDQVPVSRKYKSELEQVGVI